MTSPTSPDGRRRPALRSQPASNLEGVVFKTAFGWAGAAFSTRGLRHIILPQPSRNRAQLGLKRLGVHVNPSPLPPFRPLLQTVKDYFRGKRVNVNARLDLSGLPPFTQRVMNAARKIGWGRVLTYGEVAAAAGSPGAARAVGAAMARNPIPLAVP